MRVHLTFDDGPDLETDLSENSTWQILDHLAETGHGATFFISLAHRQQNPALYDRIVDRMLREGHEVGVHGHQLYAGSERGGYDRLSDYEVSQQISEAKAYIQSRILAVGDEARQQEVSLIRAPGGAINGREHIFATHGLRHVGWHVDPRDWDMNVTDSEVIDEVGRALGRPGRPAGPSLDGKIILLHDQAQHLTGGQAADRTHDVIRGVIASLGQASSVPIIGDGDPQFVPRGRVEQPEGEPEPAQAPPAPQRYHEPVRISDAEVERVARLVYAEDTGQGHDQAVQAWVAIASVIRNRVADGRWPGTAEAVITQNMQFEPMRSTSGLRNMATVPADDLELLQDIVRGVFDGRIGDPTGGGTHFLNMDVQSNIRQHIPDWVTDLRHTYVTKIGGNTFMGGDASQVQDAQIDAALGLARSVSQLQIQEEVYHLFNNFQTDTVAHTQSILQRTGREAIVTQIALRRAAQTDPLDIRVTQEMQDRLDAEIGLMSEEELAELGIAPDGSALGGAELSEEEQQARRERVEALELVSIDGKIYSGARANLRAEGEGQSATELLALEVGESFNALTQEEQQSVLDRLATESEEARQRIEANARDHAAATAGQGEGFSEELFLLGLLGASMAYMSGNPEAGDRILDAIIPGAANPGQSTRRSSTVRPDRGVDTTGVDAGSRTAGGTTNGPAPRDVIAGEDLGGNFTNNPNYAYWVSLDSEGNPVAGNMIAAPATPMSTTKMATLLTLSDMMRDGDLPESFLRDNAARVNRMMQSSSNVTPYELASLAGAALAGENGFPRDPFQAFVQRMNVMAEERGLEGTTYASATGLNKADNSKTQEDIRGQNVTTALDAARVGFYLNRDHPEIAQQFADIGSGHTGRRFDGVNGTTMGKTGTGFGNEGRNDRSHGANRAWVGMIGRNGAAYAVLEATDNEFGTAVRNASHTAANADAGQGIDVEARRAEIRERRAEQARNGQVVNLPASSDGSGGRGDGEPLLAKHFRGMQPFAVQRIQQGIDQLAENGIHLPLRDHQSGTSATKRPDDPNNTEDDTNRHVQGIAIDFHTSHLTAEQKREVIATFVGLGANGVGFYTGGRNATGSLHIDFRNTPEVKLWGYNGRTSNVHGRHLYPPIVNEGIQEGLARREGRGTPYVVPEEDRPRAEPASSAQRPVVVLDVGHGWVRQRRGDGGVFDGGATGPGGVTEYDANMRQAEALAESFREQGFDVVFTHDANGGPYTRDNPRPDMFQSRIDTVHRLREQGRVVAGYFSVHHDGNDDSRVNGTAVAMHPNAPTALLSAGRAVADSVLQLDGEVMTEAREGYMGSLGASRPGDNSPYSPSTYGNLLPHRSSVIQAGSAFEYEDNHWKSAYWNVTDPLPDDVPGILLERGFMSNPEDFQRIQDPRARARYADAVASGFASWYRQRNPQRALQAGAEAGQAVEDGPRFEDIELPEEISEVMSRFDLDGNGILGGANDDLDLNNDGKLNDRELRRAGAEKLRRVAELLEQESRRLAAASVEADEPANDNAEGEGQSPEQEPGAGMSDVSDRLKEVAETLEENGVSGEEAEAEQPDGAEQTPDGRDREAEEERAV